MVRVLESLWGMVSRREFSVFEKVLNFSSIAEEVVAKRFNPDAKQEKDFLVCPITSSSA